MSSLSPRNDSELSSAAQQAVRGLQIITAAMVMGCVVFLGIAFALQAEELSTDVPLEAIIGLVVGGGSIVLHGFVPSVLKTHKLSEIGPQSFQDSDQTRQESQLLPILQLTHIVSCALLEGGVMLNLVMFFISASLASVGMAVFMMLLLLAKFPTASRVSTWLDHTRQAIEMR